MYLKSSALSLRYKYTLLVASALATAKIFITHDKTQILRTVIQSLSVISVNKPN